MNTFIPNNTSSHPLGPIAFKRIELASEHLSALSRARLELPPGVEERLADYADFLSCDRKTFIDRFCRCPVYNSLDSGVAIADNYLKAIEKLTGKPGIPSATCTTFSFPYLQSALILDADQNNFHKKITTVFIVSNSIAKAVGQDNVVKLMQLFEKITLPFRHDPLHSINGSPDSFKDLDIHYRYGGAELAALLVNSAYLQDRLKKDTSVTQDILDLGNRYLEIVRALESKDSKISSTTAKLYFCSIMLRHLLVGLPFNNPIVQELFSLAEDKIGVRGKIELRPERWRSYIDRDFSDGSHTDVVPLDSAVHCNRARTKGLIAEMAYPYNHGRGSILTPWVKDFFQSHFGAELNKPYQASISELLLVDIFRRGHGHYLMVSALAGLGDPLDIAKIGARFVAAAKDY